MESIKRERDRFEKELLDLQEKYKDETEELRK
jgi:hypothetical protein